MEMMKSNRIRVFRLSLVFLICWFMAACASYPDEPRNPKVADDTYTIEEDGILSVSKEQGLLSNDSPEEGPSAMVVTTDEEQTTDQNGSIEIEEDGSFIYKPAPNFNGKDQINYLVENGKGKQSQGTVFFKVISVNDPPEPKDDILKTPIIKAVTISVLDNDADPDGDKIHLVKVDPPAVGTARANADGTIVYTPPPNHEGDVRIRYTVADVTDEQAEAWISLTVIALNHSIETNPDTISLAEDESRTLPTSNLLANDRDLLNGTLSVTGLGSAQNGTTILEGPNFTYTPNADFFGNDTFTYIVRSHAGATASSTVNVTVTPVNDPPTISQIPNPPPVMAGSTANIPFSIEDLDNPFPELTVGAEIVSSRPPNLLAPNSLTLSGNDADRILRIATNPARSGNADITVNVDDGQESSSQSFRLTVTPLAGRTPLYRFFNGTDHLYKTNSLIPPGGYGPTEGIACYVFAIQRAGTVPLHRFGNRISGDHFYTINPVEIQRLQARPDVWSDEGVACYVFPSQRAGAVALHRYYNGLDHFYTINPAAEILNGYTEEGIACWVSPIPPSR
jgi:hypothetical protein